MPGEPPPVHKLCPIFAALALCLASCLLVGCFGMPSEPQVAATVNGDAIYESEVTEYIEGFRAQNPEYESDEGWAEFLRGNGYTAESIRRLVLDSVFIPKVLIHQECAARGITLTDSELDAVIEEERQYYEGRYGDNSWESVLSSYGYDEESWRENEADRLLEEQLIVEVVGAVQADEQQIQAEADANAAVYNGKHSYYRSFSSEQAGQRALSALRETEGAMHLSDFETENSPAVNAGWNSIPSDREAMSTEYISALNELGQGEYSGLVQQGSQWIIVFCDQVYNVTRNNGHVNLSAMPAEIYRQVRQDAHDALVESTFADWMAQRVEAAGIEYVDIPDGLPYDVNVALSKDADE